MPLKPKLVSIKQAAKAVEKALLYYDRGVFLVNKPTDMVCQMSYSTSAKVSECLQKERIVTLKYVQYEKFNVLCKGISAF
jgi:16S rRNA U516 pseudouridylate synthase RsuA-like enzyme